MKRCVYHFSKNLVCDCKDHEFIWYEDNKLELNLKFMNKWEKDFEGLLEGMGWEYDYGGKNQANSLKRFIKTQIIALIDEIEKTATFEPGVSSNGWYQIYKDELDKIKTKYL